MRAAKRKSAERETPNAPRERLRAWGIAALLALGTFLLYVPSLRHGFVAFDDPVYVTSNEHVLGGLSVEGLRWALTTPAASNWHPLTWVSHMLDVQLYGLEAGGHHLTGVLLHAANVALLFLVLAGMTGAAWRSAAVAALFACHPLRVESVTWVSERKDVLCALFFMLTLGAYLRYARRPTPARYAAVAGALALGLTAKQMLVTVPFLLLLLDYWPLRRIGGEGGVALRRLILEKLPLLAVCAAASAVTFAVQRLGGAVAELEGTFTLANRVGNAFVAVARYVGKTVWPTDLAVFYPHPGTWPVGAVAAGVAVTLAASLLAVVAAWRGRRYAFAGWFWFLGMLVPVIGLVQVGRQSMADRYTYLPGIGLTVVVVWAAADVLGRWRHGPKLGTVLTAAVVATLSAATVRQQHVWSGTLSLFTSALASTDGDNYLAHGYVASALAAGGDLDAAERHFQAATRQNPEHADAWANWGNLLVRRGQPAEAAERYEAALRLRPGYAEARLGLGTTHALRGDFPAAEREYRAAVRLRPRWPDALANLAGVVRNQGRVDEAFWLYAEVLRIDPNHARSRRGVEELRPHLSRKGPSL